MVREVISSLRCRAGAIYVDGTVGGGGHAEAILLSTAPDGLLIGIDADADAVQESEKRLAPFGKRKILVKGNFAEMDVILAERNIGQVDGILLDLGVSSHQVDTAKRGFSFSLDAPLDMRMDRSRGHSAYDLIHTLSEEELERIDQELWRGKDGKTHRPIHSKQQESFSHQDDDRLGRPGGPGVSP